MINDHKIIITLFQGIPTGDEFDPMGAPAMIKLLSIPGMDYGKYSRRVGFSDDSMAYQSPYFTYDKRFPSHEYRAMLFYIYGKCGIKTTSYFFTKVFQDNIKITPTILNSIESVFFSKSYLRWD